MSKLKSITANCPIDLTINILSGKWKIAILWNLSKGAVRFNELKRMLPGITHKILTMQLRELERDKMIYRKVYNEIPPKVEYGLTEVGKSIRPVLKSMCDWGKEYKNLI
ncbi:transcriptional regulator, HxlR family [Clostridium pasteurianum DSM 525 = ATCC 6013]|uniref:Transcriptional regulator, HxlR family n=1 Tax=Clostridium pasteurianum DSM 525 = ATCC 6013 TaxID=1262449 RepID=A0A0H3JAI2_CLOPA|nr:helix-turn-helix domain-containing protein [Clostridium pasteurianum]AJA49573.1 transcriptional regulator, HxlR family [Clostridium pasteurianum DSM 525 = ATCC 6013]AJA53561.1 transcriptional regulator, HxlR family [Clostridium pasteurianum DSM 525 = ATCC 6013]AOZ76727.1 HxlR family transcriptional regulator [Clostridium pasteurianum DSM 525 = ATCC 6013]AOZ80524.1 HxlR family transcriptional regulator [Clostridium pasteurianum]ELP58911.1 HxlR family transcriptional regulator [Clostridium pa